MIGDFIRKLDGTDLFRNIFPSSSLFPLRSKPGRTFLSEQKVSTPIPYRHIGLWRLDALGREPLICSYVGMVLGLSTVCCDISWRADFISTETLVVGVIVMVDLAHLKEHDTQTTIYDRKRLYDADDSFTGPYLIYLILILPYGCIWRCIAFYSILIDCINVTGLRSRYFYWPETSVHQVRYYNLSIQYESMLEAISSSLGAGMVHIILQFI